MPERWVSQIELSDITGFHVKSLQTIYRREPGVLVTRRAETGTGNKLEYKLPDTIINLFKREFSLGNSRKNKKDDSSSKKLSDRKLEAETQIKELELHEMQGELIRLDEHEKRLDAICGRLSAALEVIPSKYLSRIQVARSEVEAQEVGEKIRDDTKASMFALADDLEDVTDVAEVEEHQENEGGIRVV